MSEHLEKTEQDSARQSTGRRHALIAGLGVAVVLLAGVVVMRGCEGQTEQAADPSPRQEMTTTSQAPSWPAQDQEAAEKIAGDAVRLWANPAWNVTETREKVAALGTEQFRQRLNSMDPRAVGGEVKSVELVEMPSDTEGVWKVRTTTDGSFNVTVVRGADGVKVDDLRPGWETR